MAPAQAAPPSAAFWDAVASSRRRRGEPGVWRRVCDAVNGDLLERWLPDTPGGTVLKTDLFDEVAGHGLVPRLLQRFATVVGVDVSSAAVAIARAQHGALEAEVADVRQLPFAAASFDAVVSNSTLDHLAAPGEVVEALAELRRVLRPGGVLLVTMDNRANPVVALRDTLPRKFRGGLLVPFPAGTSAGPRRLRRLLAEAGLLVTDECPLLHAPRVPAMLGAHLVDRRGGPAAARRCARAVTACEALGRLPTRYLTGYYAAARAVRA